jgi:trehalose 6-phosphate synthase
MLREGNMGSAEGNGLQDRQGRLVVVSNRLPITVRGDGNERSVELSAGGLVTAMDPVLRRVGGLWIGWPGTSEDVEKDLERFSAGNGYALKAVRLSQADIRGYYYGFSNEVLWPLFHGFHSRCRFKPEYWETYQTVNDKFARTVAEATGPADFVWIHDYHLIGAAQKMAAAGARRRCGFFLHTPFPEPECFLKLPWRQEIVDALLEYDIIGFQTSRDQQNFIRALDSLSSRVCTYGPRVFQRVRCGGRETTAGVFPISIDFQEFYEKALSRSVIEQAGNLGRIYSQGQTLLGVDRLDYSKGIPERLQAFRQTLLDQPDLQGRLTLVQVVVPSREGLEDYRQLKEEIELLVGQINGEFSSPAWIPVHYLYRSLSREELISFYLNTDIALITPLRDGMNLVAKEYCACNWREDGLLILSEFAGTAAQLHDSALLVNPYDVQAVSRAIRRGASMSSSERGEMMRRARRKISLRDINWWVYSFLQAALFHIAPEGVEAHDFRQHSSLDPTAKCASHTGDRIPRPRPFSMA